MEFIHEKNYIGGHKVRKVQILYRYKLALTVDLDPQESGPVPISDFFFFFFFFFFYPSNMSF